MVRPKTPFELLLVINPKVHKLSNRCLEQEKKKPNLQNARNKIGTYITPKIRTATQTMEHELHPLHKQPAG